MENQFMLFFGLKLFLDSNIVKILVVLLGMVSITSNAFALGISQEMESAPKIQYEINSGSSDTVSFLIVVVLFFVGLLTYYKVSNIGKYDTFSIRCKKCGQKTQGLKCIKCERKNQAKWP